MKPEELTQELIYFLKITNQEADFISSAEAGGYDWDEIEDAMAEVED